MSTNKRKDKHMLLYSVKIKEIDPDISTRTELKNIE